MNEVARRPESIVLRLSVCACAKHTHSVTWLLREKEGMSICQDTILCQATSREELHANLNHIVRGYQEVSYISALLILVVANRRRGMPITSLIKRTASKGYTIAGVQLWDCGTRKWISPDRAFVHCASRTCMGKVGACYGCCWQYLRHSKQQWFARNELQW